MPSVYGGSPHSQEKRLAVQYLTIRTANGYQLHWTEIPNVISAQFTIQDRPAVEADFVQPDDCYQGKLWGSCRIWKITDLRAKTAAAVTREAVAA